MEHTKADLQDALNELGIWWPRKATKQELLDLLTDAEEDLTTDDTDTGTSGNTATSYADVSGLCRQCNRPADHKHIGV